MISVKHLIKHYGDVAAVDDISFEVEEGHVYGFLGPNGAGKSTTMNIMTGCLSASSGTVTIDGFDIFEEPVSAKKCIGYLPEQPPLYLDQTVEEYLRFVAEAKGVGRKEIREQIDKVILETGLDDVRNRVIKQLSKGYKQRTGIAQALLGSPKVIILDEPTVGLDPLQIIEIRNLIVSLGKEHTVILSSHILSEIQSVCDRVLVISHGRLLADDTMKNFLKNSKGQLEDVFIELLSDDEKARKLAAEAEARMEAEEQSEASESTETSSPAEGESLAEAQQETAEAAEAQQEAAEADEAQQEAAESQDEKETDK